MEKNISSSRLRRVISWLVLGLIGLLVLFSYLTTRYGWKIYLEIFSHFQVQYLVISLVLLGLLLLLRRKKQVYIGMLLCAILSLQVVPWYFPPGRIPRLSRPESNVRVLVANINTQNKSYEKVLELVRAEKPDLAIFMEVDEVWRDQLNTLDDLLPYSSGQSNPYNLGLLVYGNQSLSNSRVDYFGTDKNTSVIAQLAIADQPVTLLATHPLPPVKPSFFQSRNYQMDLISQYLAEEENPVILAGDLNMTMWSPYYRRLRSKTGLRDARQGFGILPTWPTKGTYTRIPGWLTGMFKIPIDHCLISHGLKVTDIHVGSDTGSDHKPLIIDLRINSRS